MIESSDFVVRARALRKVYRLYAGPGQRFLDMFGLLGDRPGAYSEHAALDGIDLDVRRGEKVAFIGRNGAGKSTLLKLITNVIEPTAGTIAVSGKVHALLQIGTGFHPDFTGRENVYAYLAQLGVSGREANAKYAEIVDFAELEEYIGQPVKTYSTGMAVRLMFATATAITPELLVLDEVLGVGDAYFAQKSYERIRELCSAAGTTVLLVTHDVYSAVKMCERVIWLDRGRILMDGGGTLVVRAYEDSIRQQEENRLRIRKQQRLEELERSRGESRRRHVLLEIRPADGRPLSGLVYFSRLALRAGGRELAVLPLGDDAFDESRGSHLQQEASRWGDATWWNGRESRPLLNHGGAFHKASGVFAVPGRALDAAADARVEFDYWSECDAELVAECYCDSRSIALGRLPIEAGRWIHHEASLSLDGAVAETMPALNTTGIHGSGAVVVRAARILDSSGAETYSLRHGEAATFEIEYAVVEPDLRERSQVVIAIHRDGVQDVCRWIGRDLLFDGRLRPGGTLCLSVPKLLLTDGEYSVTILIAKEGYYDQPQAAFYTLNRDVYFCASRLFDFVVRGAGLIGSGTVSVAEGEWLATT
jgi:ABC-type polysaccharide/polyol phosphate transport system ATPase subunit